MNRSIGYAGVAVILLGLALVASPIALTGQEQFTIEQESGLLIAPVGLVVVWLGAVAPDPRRTTVVGAFGNPDEAIGRPELVPKDWSADSRTANPRAPVHCRYCRTIITYELSQCPRCARPRECRGCGRPLGMVLERATCPRCARPEAFCNCARFVRPPTAPPTPGHPRGW